MGPGGADALTEHIHMYLSSHPWETRAFACDGHRGEALPVGPGCDQHIGWVVVSID
ncbi:MAG: hypothetical protein OXG37_16605 [Actinomycetia bacterium]|nr:hypothetical protein [Actinomycetes bacterium]